MTDNRMLPVSQTIALKGFGHISDITNDGARIIPVIFYYMTFNYHIL